MLDMLDPLNGVEPRSSDDDDGGYGTPTGEDKENGHPISEAEKASAVLSWSVAKVKKWLKTSVAFEPDRTLGVLLVPFSPHSSTQSIRRHGYLRGLLTLRSMV